MLMPRTVLIIK